MAKSPPRLAPPLLNCAACKTCKSAEWSVLGEELLPLIDEAKVTRRYRAGDPIYNQGEACTGIFCIEAGIVAVRQADTDGNSKIVRTVEAGQTLGYEDYFAGKGYRASAYCLEPATICFVGSDRLRKVLDRSPAIGLAFLAHSAEDLQQAHAMSMYQALYTVRVRVAQLLLRFKDYHGISDGKGSIEVTLPMSWHEAAELVGARAETVSRALQALEQDHIIRTEGRKVLILDLDLLLDEIEQSGA